MGLTYRREIDGLRAIAVAAVVLYHAGVGHAGFVGVDIFFVISGYLITALLLKEDRIDLLAFYARRVRRILPAAAVLVVAVLAAAPWFLSPQGVSAAANSAGAASLFGANVFFQLTTGGYFDAASDQMPLLHLWSLSVEEQFYFVWPALLMLVPRRFLLPTLAGIALASFGLAEWLIRSNPEAAFYQMPARAWELAAGGLVACLPPRALPRWVAPAGLALTLAACATPFAHFPGVGALPAVVGAALLLAALHGGATNAVLASRPMVGLGLISYSLYLWHWPLLAYYRATVIGQTDTATMLALCLLAVGLAWISYRWIEQPFRRLRWPSARMVAAGAGTAAVLALCGFAFAQGASKGEPSNSEALAIRAERDVEQAPLQAANPTVVVWGDSYALRWQPLAAQLAAEQHGQAATFSETGCPPLMDFTIEAYRTAACRALNRATVARLAHADTVILAFNWQRYVGDRAEPLRATLDQLAGVRRVIVVAPTPWMQDDLPKCIRRGADCGVSRVAFDLSVKPLRAQLEQAVAGLPNVEVLDVTDTLCTSTRCPGFMDGAPVYSDRNHLTRTAMRAIITDRQL